MAYSSMYGKQVARQMQGVVLRPAVGMNEYNESTNITDNYLSDALDVISSKNESICFYRDKTDTLADADFGSTGMVYAAIADKIPTSTANLAFQNHVVTMVHPGVAGSDAYLDYLYDVNIDAGTKSSIDISSYNLSITAFHSMCAFYTEAKRWICYTNSLQKLLFIYDYTTLATVILPFYPKKLVSHANRVFALDTGNKLWWCRAGDLYSWYGTEYDDDRIVVSVDMANVAYTIAAQPDVPRICTVTITPTSTVDTLGVVTFVGVSSTDTALTEVVIPASGTTNTKYAYKSLTSVTTSGWTAVAGADKIKIGVGAIAQGYVQADAGYWTLENERVLMDMVALSNNIFIFGESNIYNFSGYSYDTFALSKSISDVGCTGEIAVANNVAYFTYAGDVYEFNGDDYPRVISRPMEVNGSVSNGTYGGIDPDYSTYTGVSADKNYLYLYQKSKTSITTTEYMQLYIYIYDIKARSWWKSSGFGFAAGAVGDRLFAKYVAKSDRTGFYNIMSYDLETLATKSIWRIYSNKGKNVTGIPYVVTKAYNSLPSEKSTLTSLILSLKYAGTDEVSIVVSYSLTANGDDFIDVWEEAEYHFNSDVQQIEIQMPVSAISRANHYRLKIAIDSDTYIYLYNIERRFRTSGRSR